MSRSFPIKAGFILLALALVSGCAKVGDPRPPEVLIPQAAADLSARQLSDSVLLTVSRPARNTDGSEATTVKEMNVYRLARPAAFDAGKPLPEAQFLEEAVLVLSIPSARFSEYLQKDVLVIQDKLELPDKTSLYSHAFWYAVLFLNNRNQTAGLGNQVSIKLVPMPDGPTGLSSEVTEHAVRLKWTAPSRNADASTPPRIAGYNVFRSENPQERPALPMNTEPLNQAEYEDRNFRFDATYYYYVTTVGSLDNPKAESLPSQTLAVETRDIFPPAPPEDFSAIVDGNTVVLLWVPSPSPDLAGYRLYRQEEKSAAQEPVTDELIRTPGFRDKTDPEKKFEYWIKAVDTHGNESAPLRAIAERP